MKQILWVYGITSLLVFALLSVLSYDEGLGYVYVLWRGIQIQTTVWFVAFALLILGLILQLIWLTVKKSLIREKRKSQQVDDFKILHPYEQLGVLWVLGGEVERQEFIQPVFESSGLLNDLVKAYISFRQGQFEQALIGLQNCPPDTFELVEILRIEIFLAKGDGEQALSHLQFLNGHDLSPWLEGLKGVYTHRITKLWGDFAIRFPWLFLKASTDIVLDVETKQAWLSKLLLDFDIAHIDDLQNIIEFYQKHHQQIQDSTYEVRSLWLKLISRLPEMADEHQKLALALMDERFDQDIFYLWFQQQLLKQNPDYNLIEQELDFLESKYPTMPILTFARWHIYMATSRENEAQDLLNIYPDNALMSYLRIKATLNGDPDLIQQLNLVFEKNINFIHIKI